MFRCLCPAVTKRDIVFHLPITSMSKGGIFLFINPTLAETFLLSTVLNTFADKSPNRPWYEKVARAALISVPVAVTIDTTEAIAKIASQCPSLEIDNNERPASVPELAQQVQQKISKKGKLIVAEYTRKEDLWRNDEF